MRLVFDLESDGFLDTMTKIHVLVVKDIDAGKSHTFLGKYIEDGVWMLNDADEVIGHNIIKFDIPAIQKLYPSFNPQNVTDTLVLSRLLYPEIRDKDAVNSKKGTFPKKLTGAHTLEAWGYRIGNYKGDFKGPWDICTDEMVEYCEQDVEVTNTLYSRLMAKQPSPMSVWIEHEFATILAMQEAHGFGFDRIGAASLYSTLVGHRLELTQRLKEAFPPLPYEWVPKANNKKLGYVKGEPVTWYTEFNPSSRQQIAKRLKMLGWEPQEFTPSGEAKVDEMVLEGLPYPEAKLLAEYFLIEKRIGQLAEGDQAWLRLVTDKDKIHGAVNPNGAVTGRCTHSRPNIAQVPKVGSPYGKECRSLFRPSPGRVLVGVDLSGLELRCLAHFMAKWDDGAYARVLLEGDIHTVNQQAAGLPTRDNAKTFIYAFLYGAGDWKIGHIVDEQAPDPVKKATGNKLKKRFLAKTPALKKLKEVVGERASTKKYLLGLDGRKLHVRSAHSALNTLLQSAGALIAKVATIYAYHNLFNAGYKWGKDWTLVAHVHDELQVEARPQIAEEVGKIIVRSMQEAGEYFKFRVPITGEWKVGTNWAETH
jgi:DNA polymerase I-like protein with 3'-5' exonuclease and polymerase domains